MSQLLAQHAGGVFSAFKHDNYKQDDEGEYRRLRDLASQEAERRNSCFERSQSAYHEGNGALAHELSEQGKQHDANMDQYNQQAANFIFRANNADSKADEIDLHGLFVQEAIFFVEQRLLACKAQHADHLHMYINLVSKSDVLIFRIVGKGIHSEHHIQKIKPAMEDLCSKHNLRYRTEPNAGRLFVEIPENQGGAWQQPQYPPQQQYPPPQLPQQPYNGGQQQQPYYGPQPQQGGAQAAGGRGPKTQKLIKLLKKFGPRLLKKGVQILMRNMR